MKTNITTATALPPAVPRPIGRSHTGKCYRIRRGRNMNIYEVGTGRTRVAIWCFGPVGHLPLGDVMLAQKLALETDEQAAFAVANRILPGGVMN